jgi:hypothetical protein
MCSSSLRTLVPHGAGGGEGEAFPRNRFLIQTKLYTTLARRNLMASEKTLGPKPARKKPAAKKPAARKAPAKAAPATAKDADKRCGLCGKQGKLTKTPCCGNWICDDSRKYVMFSYARNSCFRNHDRYTLCAFHHHEKHGGDWKNCKKCLKQLPGKM